MSLAFVYKHTALLKYIYYQHGEVRYYISVKSGPATVCLLVYTAFEQTKLFILSSKLFSPAVLPRVICSSEPNTSLFVVSLSKQTQNQHPGPEQQSTGGSPSHILALFHNQH